MSLPSDPLGSMMGGRDGAINNPQPSEDVDSAVLLTYLQHEFGDDGDSSHQSSTIIHAPSFRPHPPRQGGTDAATSQPLFRGPEAPQTPAIPIPPSLAELASVAAPPIELDITTAADDILDTALAYDEYGERGEMGGKRRKLPHERAGWKEMDENPPKKGRRGPRGPGGGLGGPSQAAGNGDDAEAHYKAWAAREGLTGAGSGASGSGIGSTANGSGGVGPADGASGAGLGTIGTLEQDLAAAHEQMGLSVGLTHEEGQSIASALADQHFAGLANVQGGSGGEEADGAESAAKGEGKTGERLDRAEQNRRAQQVYRRKREERMKQLEAAAAALEPTRKALADVQAKFREMAQSLESTRIENSALRAALLTASKNGASLVSPDGALVINASMSKAVSSSNAHVERALDVLTRQAKELAQVNRERRAG